jgi:hypothetical protein
VALVEHCRSGGDCACVRGLQSLVRYLVAGGFRSRSFGIAGYAACRAQCNTARANSRLARDRTGADSTKAAGLSATRPSDTTGTAATAANRTAAPGITANRATGTTEAIGGRADARCSHGHDAAAIGESGLAGTNADDRNADARTDNAGRDAHTHRGAAAQSGCGNASGTTTAAHRGCSTAAGSVTIHDSAVISGRIG